MYEFLDWQVRDVMSDPITVGPDTSIHDAEELLGQEGFNSLPIVDGQGELLGVVTSLDLLKAFRFGESTLPQYSTTMKRPVAEVMTREVETTRPRTPLTRVLEKLVITRNKSLPVVEDGRVVGVVAREDVMEALRRADQGELPV